MKPRHKTRKVRIGGLFIGGGHAIAIQSMVKYPTKDIKKVVSQIRSLEKCGCEIVRLAIRDEPDAMAIPAIKKKVSIPLVADVHFNWKLAILAIKAGIDKIRLNPGNIYKKPQIRQIVELARERDIPIRVGVNSGSIPKALAVCSKLSLADKLVKAAMDYIEILETLNFRNIVLSLKCSNILDNIEAYEKISKRCAYPLHLGLTATGQKESGKIKSAMGVGILLEKGLGDTLRISLTDRSEEEVKAAKYILSGLGLRNFGPEIISCPACGRTQVDIEKIVGHLENRLTKLGNISCARPLKLAVMGCVVNGPGEAQGADLALVFGAKEGLLYKGARPLRKIPGAKAVDAMVEEYIKVTSNQ